MESQNRSDIEARISEIERIIKEFNEKFNEGTSDSENFITMNEIERMWSELRNSTDNIYSDMLQDLMGSIDERDLIHKKKESTETKESF